MNERSADKRHRPAFCTEFRMELVQQALEDGGTIRRVDYCPLCWSTLTAAAGRPASVLVLRLRSDE